MVTSDGFPSGTEAELLVVLAERGELSGLQAAKAYEEITGGTIRFGSVYALMDRMSSAGWVRAREEWSGKRRTRFFRVEPEGTRALRRYYDREERRRKVIESVLPPDPAAEGGLA